MPAAATLLRILAHTIGLAPFLRPALGSWYQFQIYRHRHAQAHFVLEILRKNPNFIDQAGAQLHCLDRSEEHTSELQSPCNLACSLPLGKKSVRRSATAPAYPGRGPPCTRRRATLS